MAFSAVEGAGGALYGDRGRLQEGSDYSCYFDEIFSPSAQHPSLINEQTNPDRFNRLKHGGGMETSRRAGEGASRRKRLFGGSDCIPLWNI